MTSITLFSLPTQDLMLQWFAPLSFTFPNKMRKERDITKLKLLGHSEVQNNGSSTYVDGFKVNTTFKVI